MTDLLPVLTVVGLAVLALNIALCVARAVIGPSPFDRIMALECVSYNLSGAIVLVSIRIGTAVFMDVLLVLALLGFVATLALTAYLEKSLGS